MEKPPITNRYDQIYSELDKDPSKEFTPRAIVTKIPSYITTGKVLELGAGQGRNAIWLAKQGFVVDAWDISDVGTAIMERDAEAESLPVTVSKTDAREPIPDMYEVIVSTHLLHHFTREEAMQVIANMKNSTFRGGLNVISSFTEDVDFPQKYSEKFYLKRDELRDIYKDWEVLEYEVNSGVAMARDKEGNRLETVTASIIARKP